MAMQQVAHHLQLEALKAKPDERDAFARSCYNRYYYASFLTTRSMVKRLYPERVAELGHADYPKFLKGTVLPELSKAEQKARKNADTDLQKELARAKSAVNSLAAQFELANTTRIVADYHPDELVNFSNAIRFSLANTTVTDAHQWLDSTAQYVQLIERVWSQLHA